jgi:hypothetical protein
MFLNGSKDSYCTNKDHVKENLMPDDMTYRPRELHQIVLPMVLMDICELHPFSSQLSNFNDHVTSVGERGWLLPPTDHQNGMTHIRLQTVLTLIFILHSIYIHILIYLILATEN